MNAPLVRVRRTAPCPICSKPDWCSVSDDGAIAICMRVSAGAIRETKDGAGHIHRLKDRDYQPSNLIQPKPESVAPAPLERRDAVYRSLLDASTLNARHAADLHRRGFSPLAIECNAYRSLPATPGHVLKLCGDLASGHNLANVPGFYRDAGRWRFTIYRPGFFIPVRDPQGRIQGCQIRQDYGTRYLWFSSAQLDDGASSGAPIHFARPWRVDQTGEAIITEGALKADITAELLDVAVIGVPGVSTFGFNFGAWLKTRLPKLSAAFVAYDQDWRSNEAVKTALGRLFDSLEDAGLNAEALDWGEAKKGIDDFLTQEAG